MRITPASQMGSTNRPGKLSGAVYSYLRFSTPEQLKGDSRKRQLEKSEAWAAERGLQIDESMSDLGISAFRGANATDGALGSFLRLCELGKIRKGSILLVENLDRLSRQTIRKALQQFLSIIEAGVTIVTLCDDHEYTPDKCEMLDLMQSLMIMSRAHEESLIKSQRQSSAWKGKRERATATGEVLTKQIPSWLAIKDKKFVVDKPKAAVIKEIFRMAISGLGATTISKRLNHADVPLLPREGKYSRKFVLYTLHNRATIGEYQSSKVVIGEDGVKRYAPEGKPVPNYFPAVITETEFFAAQHSVKLRCRTGGRGKSLINLFSGLLYSKLDGSKIVITDKGRGGKRLTPISVVEGWKDAKSMPRFPVNVFDYCALEKLADPPIYLRVDGSEQKDALDIEAAKGEIEIIDRTITMIQDSFLSSQSKPSPSNIQLLSKLDAKRATLQTRIEENQGRAATTGDDSIASLFKLLNLHKNGLLPHEQRVDLQAAIRRVVERVDVEFSKTSFANQLCEATITLRNGRKLDMVCKAVWQDCRVRDENGHYFKGEKQSWFSAVMVDTENDVEYAIGTPPLEPIQQSKTAKILKLKRKAG